MGELNISPPRGQPTAGTTQEKRVPMVQIYIYVFLKITGLEYLSKMEHFCVKLGISCTAGVTYK